MARLTKVGILIAAAATMVSCTRGITNPDPSVGDEALASTIPWDKLSGRIAYSRGCGDGWDCIYVIDAATRTVRLVRRYMDNSSIRDVAWSPDGSVIYYARSRYSGGLEGTVSLFVEKVNLEGTVANLAEGLVHHPAVARDGRVAYIKQSSVAPTRICVLGGACVSVGIDQSTRFAWSPDGESILVPISSSLYEVPLTGGPHRSILRASATGAEGFSEPAYTRDGARLAYVRLSGASTGEIWSAASDGTDTRRITVGGYNSEPAWSRDGAQVLFMAENTIKLVNADGTQITTVIQPNGYMTSVAWAP